MMKITKIVKTILTGACVYYAAASLILLVAKLILDGDAGAIISVGNFLLLFPFGLSISVAQLIYRLPSLPRWGRMLLHYLISLTAFLLFLWLPSKAQTSPSSTLVALFLLSLLYWFLYLLGRLTKKRFHSFREE